MRANEFIKEERLNEKGFLDTLGKIGKGVGKVAGAIGKGTMAGLTGDQSWHDSGKKSVGDVDAAAGIAKKFLSQWETEVKDIFELAGSDPNADSNKVRAMLTKELQKMIRNTLKVDPNNIAFSEDDIIEGIVNLSFANPTDITNTKELAQLATKMISIGLEQESDPRQKQGREISLPGILLVDKSGDEVFYVKGGSGRSNWTRFARDEATGKWIKGDLTDEERRYIIQYNDNNPDSMKRHTAFMLDKDTIDLE